MSLDFIICKGGKSDLYLTLLWKLDNICHRICLSFLAYGRFSINVSCHNLHCYELIRKMSHFGRGCHPWAPSTLHSLKYARNVRPWCSLPRPSLRVVFTANNLVPGQISGLLLIVIKGIESLTLVFLSPIATYCMCRHPLKRTCVTSWDLVTWRENANQ